MPLFHTTLFSRDPPGSAFTSAGVAWSYEKGSGVYVGPPDAIHKHSFEFFEERGHAPTVNYFSRDSPPFFDMEVLIRARELYHAKQAWNLLVSAISVIEGQITFSPEPFSIEPWEVGTKSYTKSYISIEGLLDACGLANRVSRGRSFTYAIHKLALSYHSASLNIMELDPRQSPRLFGVNTDPINHVYLANAITLAYSAIEELGLEIRASQNNPSKMADGTWNPIVKAEIEKRLQDSGIDLTNTLIWTLRGPRTRIEKIRPPPPAGKPGWSRGIVRDVQIQLIDALALASWLRSSTTTYRFTKTTRSLTMYDAHNIQSLARFFILKKFDLWPTFAKA